MQNPDAMKPMKLEEFVQHAETVGKTIFGWVSVDGRNKRVLYSPISERCPWLTLPEDCTVHLLNPNPFPCPGAPLQLRWFARIGMKTAEPGSSAATLMELIVPHATAAQEANFAATAIGNGFVIPLGGTVIGSGFVAPGTIGVGHGFMYLPASTVIGNGFMAAGVGVGNGFLPAGVVVGNG